MYHEGNPYVKDSLFICDADSAANCGGRTGFTAPQSEFWYGHKITFANYGGSPPLRGCHSCDTPG